MKTPFPINLSPCAQGWKIYLQRFSHRIMVSLILLASTRSRYEILSPTRLISRDTCYQADHLSLLLLLLLFLGWHGHYKWSSSSSHAESSPFICVCPPGGKQTSGWLIHVCNFICCCFQHSSPRLPAHCYTQGTLLQMLRRPGPRSRTFCGCSGVRQRYISYCCRKAAGGLFPVGIGWHLLSRGSSNDWRCRFFFIFVGVYCHFAQTLLVMVVCVLLPHSWVVECLSCCCL